VTTVAQAYVQIVPSARGFSRELDGQIGPDLDASGRLGGQRLGSSMSSSFGAAVGTLAKTGVVALAAVGVMGAKAGIETAAGMEQARISFTTMLGSGQKAEAFLKQLADFAAKTPFEFPELQTAAKSLVSAGFSADKVIPIMRTLGDVTSGMGTGSEGVKRATIALQQMSAAGKITGEDLNQLRDAGVPVFDLLAAATGKSKEAIADLAAKGKLGKKEMEQLFDALGSGKGLERFNGLMEKQSQSLSGLWSTFTDTLNVGLGQAIEPLIPMLKDGLGGAIQFLAEWLPRVGTGIQSAVTWFQSLGSSTAGASSSFSGIVTAVRGFIDVALPIVQQFTDGMRQRLEPMMPMIQSIFGTIGGIVTSVMELISATITTVTAGIKLVWDNWGQGIMDVITFVFGVIGPIIDGALKFIQGIIQTVTAIIKGDWSTAWETIKGAVGAAWDGIKEGVGKGLGWLQERLTELPGKILGWVGDLSRLLVDKGVDIVNGLIKGIASMGTTLAGWLKSWILEHIPGPIAQALDMASPSRVTAEQGRNVVRGLTLGMGAGSRELDNTVASIARRINFTGDSRAASGIAPSTVSRTAPYATSDLESAVRNGMQGMTVRFDRVSTVGDYVLGVLDSAQSREAVYS